MYVYSQIDKQKYGIIYLCRMCALLPIVSMLVIIQLQAHDEHDLQLLLAMSSIDAHSELEVLIHELYVVDLFYRLFSVLHTALRHTIALSALRVHALLYSASSHFSKSMMPIWSG